MINKLAKRLRELRHEKDMTQNDLAKAIMVPRVTYTHYELGKRTPDVDTIIRLARYFGVTVDYLVGNGDFRSWPVPWLPRQEAILDYSLVESQRGEKIADWPDEEDKYNPFL